jgi:hypothetical protein
MHDDDLTEVAEAAYELLLKMLADRDNAPDDDAFTWTPRTTRRRWALSPRRSTISSSAGSSESRLASEFPLSFFPSRRAPLELVQERGAGARTPRLRRVALIAGDVDAEPERQRQDVEHAWLDRLANGP